MARQETSLEAQVIAECLRLLGRGKRQVVAARTRWGCSAGELPGLLDYLRRHLRGVREETFANFEAKNQEPYPVRPDLDRSGDLICLPDDECDEIFKSGGWGRFRELYP